MEIKLQMDTLRYVYFVGIGGIGMSALARYFLQQGCQVAGYDKTSTPLTQALEAEGMLVIYEDDFTQIPQAYKQINEEVLVVYTPAVPKDLGILNAFQQAGSTLYKRSQVLGLISKDRFTIAVAGTHGKTTTSTMIAHVLTDSGFGCSAFLGGISSNYHTNTLIGQNDVVVVEADEYDRSFLTLHPDLAVVTSTDADHLDIYGAHESLLASFQMFLQQVQADGKIWVRKGLELPADATYSGTSQADAYASNVVVKNGYFHFDYHDASGDLFDIALGVAGWHNVENAVVCIAIARHLGIADQAIVRALGNFKGVKRRFEYLVRQEKNVYIDDYAHHPEELSALIKSLRTLYPEWPLILVFQPHLFSRTRDFVDGFAEVLSRVDHLILMDIYPARELPIEGVTSSWLLDKITLKNKQLMSEEEVIAFVQQQSPQLLVTAGAGNIDRLVGPLTQILKNA